MTAPRRRLAGALLAAVALLAAACGDDEQGPETAGGQALVGLFRMEPGQCPMGGVSAGSYFRMAQPGGAPTSGPFVINGDSPCPDKTWTALRPGADGGLMSGSYQSQANPPFDPAGNATSGRVVQPQKWFAVAFAASTNQRDPQTGGTAPAPRIVATGKSLGGDLSAFAASWNGQHFNQGAPKPDGKASPNTTGPRGTYDPATRVYALEWSSQIVGGPFNNFTGVWHLEGTFEPR